MLLLILEGYTWAEIFTYLIAGVVGLFVVIYALKWALPNELLSTTNNLLTARTTERDDGLRKIESLKKETEELEEQITTLRREVIQRMDINYQDQITIRELKAELNALKDK